MEVVGREFVLLAGLLILAAFSNAVMDLSSEDRFKKDYWNKSKSWKYKWKNNDPKQGERFPFSSTIFVFLTDGWHLMQFVFHSSWQLGIAIMTPWPLWTFIACKIFFSGVFEIIYDALKK